MGVDPQSMQDSGVQLLWAAWLLGWSAAALVAPTVDLSARDPRAGESNAVTIGEMVAPAAGHLRSASKFGEPHHERFVEPATGRKIGEQSVARAKCRGC